MSWIHFEMPKRLSLGVISVVYLAADAIARSKGPVAESDDEAATALITDNE